MNKAVIFGLVGWAFIGVAIAQQGATGFGSVVADREKPIEISADQLAINDETGVTEFSGMVEILQGDLSVNADFVQATYTPGSGAIQTLLATGEVILRSGEDEAKADRAEYAVDSDQIIMTGNVFVRQAGNNLSAERAEINLETGAATLSGRVKTVLGTAMTEPEAHIAELASENPEIGLKIHGLRKSYRKRVVIRDVSMSLQRGEVVGLLGPNGSGKTTTFYAVAGLVSADGGKVSIDGDDITALPMYRRARMGIGYLPQEMSIFRGLNVEQNIGAILDIAIGDRHKRRERLEELLAEFSIEHLRRTPAIALSGGERRRVEIARCLAANPKYLLLDEPFAGVDPIAVGEIRQLVTDLKSRGIGVLITDHNVRETLELVDRVYILHDGKVLTSGNPEDVVQNDNVRQVYLGDAFRMR